MGYWRPMALSPVGLPDACITDLRTRRILITGGHGFLGTNLREMLDAYGIRHVSPTRGEMNLENKDSAGMFLKKGDNVIHLAAAVGGIKKNTDEGDALFTKNLQMGLNVFEACKKAQVGKVLVIGTACEYPDAASMPLKEEDIWNGLPNPDTGPYGMAKRMLLYYGMTSELPFPIVHVIPTNLYGPHDHFDPVHGHVIPGMIARMLAAKKNGELTFPVWGDGTQTREFIHVEDACRGILLALWKETEPHATNLGTGKETTISDLAATIKKALGYEGEIVFDTASPTGSKRRLMDTRRAKDRLGFEASIDLNDGITDLVDGLSA